LISRVADHLFWLGRYVERAESSARVLLVTRNLALDGELTPDRCWRPALIVSGEEGTFRDRFGDEAMADGERVEEYLTWEAAGASLARSVGGARENARSIRDRVSLEAWETLNELYVWLHGDGRATWREDRHAFYRRIREAAQNWLGIVDGTMLHDDAYDFLGLGVLLERASQTARILDVHHHALARMAPHEIAETSLWLGLLRACSGLEAYMRLFHGRTAMATVTRFLVLEVRFPRSIAHALAGAGRRLARVDSADVLRRERTLARIRALEARLAAEAEVEIDRGGLHRLLTGVVDEVHAICDELERELLGTPPPVATRSQAQ
jgi:uncharacterized alpha-E superfamily protein